ncbi:MAG: type III pantothenate kinase, partial [Mycoplasmoidaceae bacterium]|nr:type III pantothenate kinase [Mycoplasmoidaceae bacterium]
FDLNEGGADILALAFYVKSCFKKGIGLSLGTANFAVGVNDKKLLGAIITPGLDHMLNTLQSSTELVNKDNKVKQSNLFFDFGINTEQALDSGSSHMLLGFINSLINMSKSKHSLTSLCICGGNSVLIKKGLDKTKLKKITFNPNAVIEGYYLLVK